MSKAIIGAHVPIFDKLTDMDTDSTSEAIPKLFLSEEELKESVISELSKLLNTRIINMLDLEQGNHTPFSYGAHITTATSTDNLDDSKKLEITIQSVIEYFEPRLRDVKVTLIANEVPGCSLFFNIEADLLTEKKRIPLYFPITIL